MILSTVNFIKDKLTTINLLSSFKSKLIVFLIFFVIKLGTAYYLFYLTEYNNPEIVASKLALAAGDTQSYLSGIDNYFKEGSYYYFNGKEKMYASRMPYYGIIYYFFLSFFEQKFAYTLLIIFQIFIESIAAICFLSLVGRICKTNFSVLLSYILLIISLNSSIYNIYLLPESLSISFLIIFLYYYYRYLDEKKDSLLFLTGLFLAFTILLKPYFAPLAIIILFLLFHSSLRSFNNIKSNFKKYVLLYISLIFFLLPWTYRNYRIYNDFIPSQINYTAGYDFTEADFAYRNFIMAWGGSLTFWDKRSAGCYFEPTNLPCEFVFPDYAFAKKYSMKDIEDVRNNFILLKKSHSDSLLKLVAKQFNNLTHLYKEEKPFRYYIMSPIIRVTRFIFHSGSYYLPIGKHLKSYRDYQFGIKLSQSFLYYFSLLIGSAGLIHLFLINKNNFIFLLIPLYLIVFFPVIFRLAEFRYFNHTYMIFLLGTIYYIDTKVSDKRNHKY